MTETLYRSFAPDLEIRSGGDGRTVHGIAIPWGVAMRIDSTLTEQWRSGAFNHQLRAANRVRYAREHIALGGDLIGRMDLMRNDAAGLYVELKVSKTPLGDETLELVKDGALPQLSIGFQEGQNARLPGGIVERVKAHLTEVASVMQGAFGDLAAVGGVRSLETDPDVWLPGMSTPNRDRVAQILASMRPLPL